MSDGAHNDAEHDPASAQPRHDPAQLGEEPPAEQPTDEAASYRLIAETIPHLVWTTSPAGFHDFFNSRWEEYIGLPADETKGFLWHTFLHPDDQQRSQDIWNHALASGEPYEIEYRFKRHDGVYRWFLGRAMPIRDSNGRIVKWFGTCTDIDEQKRAQEERSLLLIRERQARQAAEAASRARDDFIATVSHELRTPLATIIGWAGLLERGGSDPQRVTMAASVLMRSGKTLTKLVDDLLDVSRLIAGKLELNARWIDLAELVESVVDAFRSDAQQKHIELRIDRLEAIAAEIDDVRMHQVLSNLVSNAIKFTSIGHVAVALERDGHDAVLRVSDTGEGLSGEFLPFVFDRFRQADASATRVHGGLGLGLAIAKSLVELHDGMITAHSEGLGRGATFAVRVPIARSQQHDTSAPVTLRPPPFADEPALLPDALADLTVLVVDDEEDVRSFVTATLEDFGAAVISARSAEQARQALSRRHIDAIICDIAMPGETGYEFVGDLRANGRHLPVVALTAYARLTDVRRAQEAGFDAHLAKPVEPHVLVQTVRTATGR
jgi:PAS domain S-box-containing protein